ncbi:MAG TPA: glucuronate isomerase [Acidimicrobiales bacterium]|nr:glucuronate isomerase [Acidimicrobiales bacterium]
MAPHLHPHRLLPPDPGVRRVALSLYEAVAEQPLISPHGHVDARLLADDDPFADPVALLVRPDHYVLRILHTHGVPLSDLGVPSRGAATGRLGPASAGAAGAAPREVWRQLCRHWPAFRGTVMRLWLEHELATLFGIDRPLDEASADETFDRVSEQLAEPEMRPRALYRRFRLELLATTDSPLDDLAAHQALRADPSWEGRVVPTFRPDALIDPTRSMAWSELVDQLGAVSGCDTGSYSGYIAGLESRRSAFKALGATATDHGHSTIEADELSHWEASRLFDRLRLGPYDTSDAAAFSAHMLMEMARMSADDGLVMQLHPGVWRSHDTAALVEFGPDLGADFPVPTSYTAALSRLLARYGSHPTFRCVAFTVDETVFSRELAPMASYYPALWLGAPWWFLDSPDAMARFWAAVTETAGFSKSAGFVDDTRAYCSIPARHDLARRAHCGFLARLVAEHRLSEADAADLAVDFAYRLPKKAFRAD